MRTLAIVAVAVLASVGARAAVTPPPTIGYWSPGLSTYQIGWVFDSGYSLGLGVLTITQIIGYGSGPQTYGLTAGSPWGRVAPGVQPLLPPLVVAGREGPHTPTGKGVECLYLRAPAPPTDVRTVGNPAIPSVTDMLPRRSPEPPSRATRDGYRNDPRPDGRPQLAGLSTGG